MTLRTILVWHNVNGIDCQFELIGGWQLILLVFNTILVHFTTLQVAWNIFFEGIPMLFFQHSFKMICMCIGISELLPIAQSRMSTKSMKKKTLTELHLISLYVHMAEASKINSISIVFPYHTCMSKSQSANVLCSLYLFVLHNAFI